MSLKHDPSYSLPDGASAPPRRNGADGILALLVAIEVLLVIVSVPSFNAPFRNLFSRSGRPALDPSALVWANKDSGIYSCPNSPQYGVGAGSYMKQGEALTAGYQPDLGNYCSLESESRAKKPDSAVRRAGKENGGSTPLGRDPLVRDPPAQTTAR
jgi:hypothetical protein